LIYTSIRTSFHSYLPFLNPSQRNPPSTLYIHTNHPQSSITTSTAQHEPYYYKQSPSARLRLGEALDAMLSRRRKEEPPLSGNNESNSKVYKGTPPCRLNIKGKKSPGNANAMPRYYKATDPAQMRAKGVCRCLCIETRGRKVYTHKNKQHQGDEKQGQGHKQAA
jgi:hypothetical protein